MTTLFTTRSLDEAERPNEWVVRGSRVVVAAVALGVAADLVVHRSFDGRAGTLLAIVAVLALCLGARVQRITALVVAALVPAFAIWLSLRQSPWLLTLDLVAIVGLLFTVAGFSRNGDAFDVTFADAGRHLVAAVASVLRGPIHLLHAIAALGSGTLGRDAVRRVEIARGAGLALPIVVAAAILLATADGVFASFLHLPFGVDTAFTHIAAIVVGGTGALVLIAHTDSVAPARQGVRPARFGTVEVTMVLGALVGLYALFAVSQALALTRGADYVRRRTGLTYSEYARRGYFQLLAVATMTALVLLVVRRHVRVASPTGQRALVLLGEAAIALTLVIIASALHRLNVYDDAFGLTMLRLSCIVFAYWMAAVFLLIAVAYLRRDGRQWLAPMVAATALATLFVWNVVNPESIVARHNVVNAEQTIRFDADYLASLSADAVPTLVSKLPRLAPADRAALTRALCREHASDDRGFWSANRSRDRAERSLESLC
jgi:hypothetical protein